MALNDLTPQSGTDHFGGDNVVSLKRRVIAARAGQNAFADVVMHDNDGNAVDLTDYGLPSTGSVKAKFKDSVTITSAAGIVDADCTITDAATGQIRCQLPDAVKDIPGIYIAEFAVLDASDDMTFSNVLWVVVDEGLFGTHDESIGPPSLAEIRLFLRDYTQENELIDSVDFDLSEIAAAITLPVREWNESLPPLPRTYTSRTFPWRFHWLKAICGYLYSTAAEHYRRNHLPYNAGGTQIDDKNKFNQYEQKSQQLLQEWHQFMTTKKASLNINRGFGEFNSSYSTF